MAVVGGGGAGEGAWGARRRGESGKVDLARGDSDRDGGGSRSSVLMNIQYFFILNMKNIIKFEKIFMNSKSAHEI